ncbi:MAG: peptidase M48 [Chloroflexi bacterium]|nr:MAG: peptidase M48 [Chloroflexota bacterium]
MRVLLVIGLLAVITLGLGWLLGPRTPAPELPPQLVGPDAAWLERADQLSARRRPLGIASLLLTPIAWWLMIRFGWSAALRAWLEHHIGTNPWIVAAVFTCIFVFATTLLNGPLAYAGLALRRSYGLSAETTAAWLVRQGKELLVSLIVTLVMVEGLYWLLRVAPQRWWLWAAGGAILGSLLLTYLAPYVITPLFFTQRPLDDPTLRTQIMELGARTGVPISEVFVIDASTQGNEGNAYFTGIGGATRVVLYDTLLRQYPKEELLTILAHELGHWRAQHVWKGLLLTALGAPIGLWIVHLLLGWLLPGWGIRDRADVAGLPLIMLLATIGGLATLPVQNWISRQWEREADRFALTATGDPAAFQATFVRLAQQNLADPTPPPLYEGLFATHPAIGRRVADAGSSSSP